MTKRIYILGAGGFAREVYSYFSQHMFEYNGWKLFGFLDDRPDALVNYNCEHDVKGPLKAASLEEGSILIMGVANSELKQELFEHYRVIGVPFVTYIHPTAIIGRNVNVGEGAVICPHAVLTTDIEIGRCVTVNALSTIGHDARLGNYCTLSGHCDITGSVTIGDRVFLGSRSTVIPRINVGSDSIIGAGSVVIRKVQAGSTVFGNPAKQIN